MGIGAGQHVARNTKKHNRNTTMLVNTTLSLSLSLSLTHTHTHTCAHAQDASYGAVEAAHRAGDDREPLSLIRLLMLNMHAFNYGLVLAHVPMLGCYALPARARAVFLPPNPPSGHWLTGAGTTGSFTRQWG